MGQRPGVVLVPTLHDQEMRVPRCGYRPDAWDGPLLYKTFHLCPEPELGFTLVKWMTPSLSSKV